MRKSWVLCVMLGTLAWGQGATSAPPAQASQAPALGAVSKAQTPASLPDPSAAVAADAAVLTVKGVCPAQLKAATTKTAGAKPATTTPKDPADCKTVITKAEFEKMVTALVPNPTPQIKRQLAGVLPRAVAMSDAARKKGLDKTPRYEQMLKFAKMQILTSELQRNIQEEGAKVKDEDIASYYKKNPEAYEQFNLERLFVPHSKQSEPEAKAADKDGDKEEKLTDEQKKAKEAEEKAKEEQGEQEMTKLAESLRARAAAGEDFTKLQKEAFEASGMKIESPTITLPKVRRTALPAGHTAVFDLKAGEASQIISDASGHYIYRVVSKDLLPLDQVKDEIKNALQNLHTKDLMEKYQSSFSVDTNEAYFGPAAAPAPRPGMPGIQQRMQQRMMAPAGTPGGQPPAQPPASKPN